MKKGEVLSVEIVCILRNALIMIRCQRFVIFEILETKKSEILGGLRVSKVIVTQFMIDRK